MIKLTEVNGVCVCVTAWSITSGRHDGLGSVLNIWKGKRFVDQFLTNCEDLICLLLFFVLCDKV